MKNLILTITIMLCLGTLSVFGQELAATYDLTDNGGTITAQYPGTTAESLDYLVDNKHTTSYRLDGITQAWFVYESSVPVIVTSYILVSRDTLRAPSGWTFEVSSDGSSWTTLKTETNQAFERPQQARTYTTGTSTAFRFFRVSVTGTRSADLELAEWQLFGNPSTTLGPDVTDHPEGIFSSQHTSDVGEPASRMIDNSLGTKYTQTNQSAYWVQYENPSPVLVQKYSMTISCCSPDRSPRSWQLLGSNDGSSWEIIDSRVNKNFFSNNTGSAPFNTQIYELPRPSQDWASYADQAHDVLMSEYWNGSYFNQDNAKPTPHAGFNYWWHAHALDVLVDAYNRTGDVKYKDRMDELITGVLDNNGWAHGSLYNWFYDDMEWMGLACLRAYYATGDVKWKNFAIQLWEWIKEGWDETTAGGGIMWSREPGKQGKNAISNSPAVILSARLYKETNNEDYLNWSVKIYNWVRNTVVDATRGIVWDSYEKVGDEGWVFTYNQGVYIGAGLELYSITQDPWYIEEATRTATYVVNDRTKFSPRGVLQADSGSGDGGLFKGIFMRYLAQLILHGDLDHNTRMAFQHYFMDNGTSLWNNATLMPEIIFGGDWTNRRKSAVISCSNHLSGVMLFELLDELRREGLEEMAIANTQKPFKYIRLNVIANATGSLGGNSGSGLAEWQVFGEEPVATITSPASGTEYPFSVSSIVLDAEVSFTEADEVAFYYGTTLIGTDTESPYSVTWENPPSGIHAVTAHAVYDEGAAVISAPVEITVEADPTAKSVYVTAPANNSVFLPSPITFNAEVFNFPDVTQVAFYQGTTLIGTDAGSPYSVTWNNPSPGLYVITAEATNSSDEVLLSTPIQVIVSTQPDPVVSSVRILNPISGTAFDPSTEITIEAEALYAGVTQVSFYNGRELIGTDNESPYSITWTPPSGIYYVTAKAENENHESLTSQSVQLMVNNIITGIDDAFEGSFTSYPNPFSDRVFIPLRLTEQGSATIRIYNTSGQVVYESRYDFLNAGGHYLEWSNVDNNTVPEGVYIYKTFTNQGIQAGRIVRMK